MNIRQLVDGLSISRIFFAILFAFVVVFLDINFYLALLIYFLAIVTDLLDGRIARQNNIANDKGARLDVICDFIFIMVTYFGLILKDLLPFWMLIITTLKILEFFITSNVKSGELYYESFGKSVSLMFYVLPMVIVLLNFLDISRSINLILCVIITILGILSSVLRIKEIKYD